MNTVTKAMTVIAAHVRTKFEQRFTTSKVGERQRLVPLSSLLLLSLALVASASCAKTDPAPSQGSVVTKPAQAVTAIQTQVLLQGLDQPWSMAFLPLPQTDKNKNNSNKTNKDVPYEPLEALITLKSGALWHVQSGDTASAPWIKLAAIAGVPKVADSGQGGLFDVALHPQFAQNRWIYLAFAAADGAGRTGTEVIRATLQGQKLVDVKPIFIMQPKTRSSRHFGGRLVFDKAGFLYITLGDRGEQNRAQALDDHAGSVIRLHDDGRVPKDNPWVEKAGAKPEKFTLGQRNIQGAAIHPQTGVLWTHEHGPQGGDEVNATLAGANYGWPVVSYGVNYGIGTKIGEGTEKQGMNNPLAVWVPSIAPSGLAFYTGDLFKGWQGDMLVGSLRGQTLVRLRDQNGRWVEQERLLTDQVGRIRDVRVGPDGAVYLLTDASDGQLIRIVPQSR